MHKERRPDLCLPTLPEHYVLYPQSLHSSVLQLTQRPQFVVTRPHRTRQLLHSLTCQITPQRPAQRLDGKLRKFHILQVAWGKIHIHRLVVYMIHSRRTCRNLENQVQARLLSW